MDKDSTDKEKANLLQKAASLLNSDDSPRGQDDGFSDGLAGRPKSYIRMGLSAKAAIWGSKAMDSWTEAYDKAYDEGSRQRKTLENGGFPVKAAPETILTTGKSITSKENKTMIRGIDGQIELLENTENYQDYFDNTIDVVIAEMKNHLDTQDEEGLDQSTLEGIRDDFEAVMGLLENARNTMEESRSRVRQLRDNLEELSY